MKEKWRIVEEAPNYEVSNLGRVRNTVYNNRILKGSFDKDGYVKLTLRIDGKTYYKLAHRVVAIAFKKNTKNRPEVNHKNGIKNDNRTVNLEWVTKSQNQQHSIKTGLRKLMFDKTQIALIRLMLKNKVPQRVIAQKMKCCDAQIQRIKTNKFKNYKRM